MTLAFLIELIKILRKHKEYKTADDIRSFIIKLGYEVRIKGEEVELREK